MADDEYTLRRLDRLYTRMLEDGDWYGAAEVQLEMQSIMDEDDD